MKAISTVPRHGERRCRRLPRPPVGACTVTEDITERYCDRCGWVPVRDLAEALTWNAIHAAHRGMPAAGQGR